MKAVVVASVVALVVSACQNKENKSGDDKDSVNQRVVDNPVKETAFASREASAFFRKIIPSIPEQEVPVTYNENYFTGSSPDDVVKGALVMHGDAIRYLPDSLYLGADDSAYLVWKSTLQDSVTVIDFITTPRSPKGQSILHNLITVGPSGKILDCKVRWAGLFSTSVENPNGGTSAGIELTTGSIDWAPGLRFHATTAEGKDVNFEIHDGRFGALIPHF
jgi:hypothetical protein